jgi:hypothetical protein
MQRFFLACLLLSLAAVAPVPARADTELACGTPPELTTPSAPLTRVAAALAAGSKLDILALGSGSTVGENGGSGNPALTFRTPERSFPYRMADALRAMRPGLTVNLTVKGGPNMTADLMLPILRQELKSSHVDLVLWQTGTVEAVQGLRPDGLRGVLEDGSDAVDTAKADLVLIDPQFSRFLRANADLSPYETVLEQMTDGQAVTLFHRFDLTRDWVHSGEIDLERVSPEQRDKTIALLNDCLGQALARYVLTGAAAH